VVLDVVGSNPTSRPKISNLLELIDHADFRAETFGAMGSNPYGINRLQNSKLRSSKMNQIRQQDGVIEAFHD
jgi:hypothetical protein